MGQGHVIDSAAPGPICDGICKGNAPGNRNHPHKTCTGHMGWMNGIIARVKAGVKGVGQRQRTRHAQQALKHQQDSCDSKPHSIYSVMALRKA